jgi:hypothetical protein
MVSYRLEKTNAYKQVLIKKEMATLTAIEFKRREEERKSGLQREISEVQQNISLIDYLEGQLRVPVFVTEKLVPERSLEFHIQDYTKAASVELGMYDQRPSLNHIDYEVIFKAEEVQMPEGTGIPIYCRHENWENDYHKARFIQKYTFKDDFPEEMDESGFNTKVEWLCEFYLQLGVKESLVSELREKLEAAFHSPLPPVKKCLESLDPCGGGIVTL